MKTCTRPTPTTTGRTKALVQRHCPPRTSPFSTPWVRLPPSLCSPPQTPSHPWVWRPAWDTQLCQACPPRASTISATLTASGALPSIRRWRRLPVPTARPPRPTVSTGTRATPVWPPWDLSPNSTRRLDIVDCKVPGLASMRVSITVDNLNAVKKISETSTCSMGGKTTKLD